uniref:Uncharacterized protein n=1 Tax=Lepeophtheirus salmonis TaxID=72036 RepID=A0A0K2U2X1_LEPSM
MICVSWSMILICCSIHRRSRSLCFLRKIILKSNGFEQFLFINFMIISHCLLLFPLSCL